MVCIHMGQWAFTNSWSFWSCTNSTSQWTFLFNPIFVTFSLLFFTPGCRLQVYTSTAETSFLTIFGNSILVAFALLFFTPGCGSVVFTVIFTAIITSKIRIKTLTGRTKWGVDIITATISTIIVATVIVVFIITVPVSFPLGKSTTITWRTGRWGWGWRWGRRGWWWSSRTWSLFRTEFFLHLFTDHEISILKILPCYSESKTEQLWF